MCTHVSCTGPLHHCCGSALWFYRNIIKAAWGMFHYHWIDIQQNHQTCFWLFLYILQCHRLHQFWQTLLSIQIFTTIPNKFVKHIRHDLTRSSFQQLKLFHKINFKQNNLNKTTINWSFHQWQWYHMLPISLRYHITHQAEQMAYVFPWKFMDSTDHGKISVWFRWFRYRYAAAWRTAP